MKDFLLFLLKTAIKVLVAGILIALLDWFMLKPVSDWLTNYIPAAYAIHIILIIPPLIAGCFIAKDISDRFFRVVTAIICIIAVYVCSILAAYAFFCIAVVVTHYYYYFFG